MWRVRCDFTCPLDYTAPLQNSDSVDLRGRLMMILEDLLITQEKGEWRRVHGSSGSDKRSCGYLKCRQGQHLFYPCGQHLPLSLDFGFDRRNTESWWQDISNSIMLTTGAPQGCVLGSVIHLLMTNMNMKYNTENSKVARGYACLAV